MYPVNLNLKQRENFSKVTLSRKVRNQWQGAITFMVLLFVLTLAVRALSTFAPIGLGARDKFKKNEGLHLKVGDMAYHHLLAYINAGHQLRNELSLMLADCPTIIFVDSLDELKIIITYLLRKLQSQ